MDLSARSDHRIAANAVRFTTGSVEPRRRLAYWNELVGRSFGGFTVESRLGRFAFGELLRVELGPVTLTLLTSTAARVTRRADPSLASAPPAHLVELLCAGSYTMRPGNVPLQAGDFLLHDGRGPYDVEFDRPVTVASFALPPARYAVHRAALAPQVDRPRRPDGGPATLLSDFLRSVVREVRRDPQGPWHAPLGATLLSLVDLVFLPPSPMPVGAGRRQQRRKAALTVIERELANPALDVPLVARRLQISERYVHDLFREEGTTPARAIRARRLEAAAEQLRFDTRRSIALIAEGVGFTDAAHFSRAFRRRYGVSPRRFRAGR